MSAGNHAQAVARHASLLGHPRHDRHAALHAVDQSDAHPRPGAPRWSCTARSLAEAAAHAHELAARDGLVFVHPYDDPAVMAGQGTLALEMLEDAPDLDVLRDPRRRRRDDLRLRRRGRRRCKPGIEIDRRRGRELRLAQPDPGRASRCRPAARRSPKGIAVQHIGVNCLPADPRPCAATCWWCRSGWSRTRSRCWPRAPSRWPKAPARPGWRPCWRIPARFAGRRVGIPVCGGNIDGRILANVLLRGLLRDGRLLRLTMDIPDRPGVLADIAGDHRHLRRQHHRGHPPAPVRRAERAVGRARADDRSPRPAARRRDRRGACRSYTVRRA